MPNIRPRTKRQIYLTFVKERGTRSKEMDKLLLDGRSMFLLLTPRLRETKRRASGRATPTPEVTLLVRADVAFERALG